jgi:putative ABC transport system substrate-binding protein
MRRRPLIIIVALLLGVIFAGNSFSEEDKKVIVVLSSDIQPYRDAFMGFRDGMNDSLYTVKYEEFIFKPNGEEDLMNSIIALKPDLIFTIGTQASVFARNSFKEIPVVFSMVLNPVENGVVVSIDNTGGNITGVSLNIPIDLQFRALKQIKPGIHSIGMLYNAKTNPMLANEVREAVKDMNIEVYAEPISSEGDISVALNRVISKTDSLWAVPDPMIYNAQTAQGIILVTLNRNIPFMAFSKNFVKAGALAALECDYTDIGKQAAVIAAKVMAKNSAKDVKVEYPRKTVLTVNKKTAGIIGLNIEKNILDNAEIYGN